MKPFLSTSASNRLYLYSFAEPVGICVHAYGLDAPKERVECFECAKIKAARDGHRFFLEPHGTLLITKYRYRGSIQYKLNFRPGHPDFKTTLKSYEESTKNYPATRIQLNPKIIEMRALAAEKSVMGATLPRVTLSGKEYLSPRVREVKDRPPHSPAPHHAQAQLDSVTLKSNFLAAPLKATA